MKVLTDATLAPLIHALQCKAVKNINAWYWDAPDELGISECVQLALALAQNSDVVALRLNGFPAEVCLVVAEVLKNNVTLRSLGFVGPGGAGDLGQAVVSIALALKQNVTLRSLVFRGGYKSLDSHHLKAVLEALRMNDTLQNLTIGRLDMANPDLGNGFTSHLLKDNDVLQSLTVPGSYNARNAGVVDALMHNTTLQILHLGYGCLDDMAAVVEAMERNLTLTCLKWKRPNWLGESPLREAELQETLEKQLRRNRELAVQWRALVQIARPSLSTGFHSLTEWVFRRKLLAFYLPPHCGKLPVAFQAPRFATMPVISMDKVDYVPNKEGGGKDGRQEGTDEVCNEAVEGDCGCSDVQKKVPTAPISSVVNGGGSCRVAASSSMFGDEAASSEPLPAERIDGHASDVI